MVIAKRKVVSYRDPAGKFIKVPAGLLPKRVHGPAAGAPQKKIFINRIWWQSKDRYPASPGVLQ